MPNLWKIKKEFLGNILWACFGLLTAGASVGYFVWSLHEFSGYQKDLKKQGNESHLIEEEIIKKDGEKIFNLFQLIDYKYLL